MGKLDNRVAVVTGAAQGIGKAVADKLTDEGATVVGADIQPGVTKQADVSKEEDVKRLVDETVSELGRRSSRSLRGTRSTSSSGGGSWLSTSTARS
jgi:NAD(P)-dependent dehydrogenase (short-subunit alcohol dehydrogenase family)